MSKYNGYTINGCRYHTKERDDLRKTQNNRVSVVTSIMQSASAKDKNPIFGELYFYGIINEIWDLDYTKFGIPVFKCDWVCETLRKSNFLKKGKIVISVKIQNFSRSQMTKRISPLESSHEI